MKAKFVLSKKDLENQLKKLKDLGLKISYSYKTNKEVGKVLEEISKVDFSIHSKKEIKDIKDKSRIWFFCQADSLENFQDYLKKGLRNFVVDNEIDLNNLLKVVENEKIKINLSLRMKFQEHRIGTGKYFVYGLSSKIINDLILNLKDFSFIEQLGVHIHRKSQNTSEWEIEKELKDSLDENCLRILSFVNLGGGLPVKYKSYEFNHESYIFDKLIKSKNFLESFGIKTFIEPGRFLAGPCIKLKTKIIQIQNKNIIINTSIYNCALDSLLTGTKMLVENELKNSEEGEFFLVKGNSPTRDDIFRYKVKLKNPKVNDNLIFLNAGAYNYATDFFGYEKLKTIIED